MHGPPKGPIWPSLRRISEWLRLVIHFHVLRRKSSLYSNYVKKTDNEIICEDSTDHVYQVC